MSAPVTPRGIRLCNPGNIRHSKIAWRGEARTQPDPDFVTFVAPEWGLRAIAKILQSYAGRGLTSVRTIVSRWAPPSENKTDAYIADVAHRLAVDPADQLQLASADVLGRLVAAIVAHENGVQPYAADVVARGVELALRG